MKTHLDLLPDSFPIPKSAYGCCQYYTVIGSFAETDQANVYQEIPFNPQIQLACSSSWDPGQRGSGGDCLLLWSIRSMVGVERLFSDEIVHPSTFSPSCPLTSKESCNPGKATGEGFSHSSAHPSLHSIQSELSDPMVKTERQGICYSPARLFLCQATTHVPMFTCAYGMCIPWITIRIQTQN